MLRLNAVHLAVCLLPLALAGCGEPADHDDPRIRPPLVRVATVERAEAGSRAFTGVVVARTQSDLGFRVAGKVLERRVETGQSVKRGQLLLRLDPADLALQAQSQQRAVDAARARAKKAANDLARYRGLVASGAVSAAEFDQINAAAEAARADLSAAQAQANVAQNATGYAGLLAAADGVVVETLAEPGQVVSAGQAVFTLAPSGARDVVFAVADPRQLASNATFTVALLADPSVKASGSLRDISPQADPQTRTWQVRLALANPPTAMALGASATIALPESASAGFAVPASALSRLGQQPALFVIDEKNRAQPRAVTLGGYSAPSVFIRSGLRPGDRVITAGVSKLRAGEQVIAGELQP